MSEQRAQAPDPEVSENNQRNYSLYKSRFNNEVWRKAWLNDKSVKGVLKRAISEVGDTAFAQPGENRVRNARILGASREQLGHNAMYFKRNEEAVVEDAIHDATSAGVKLNLPESEFSPTEATTKG